MGTTLFTRAQLYWSSTTIVGVELSCPPCGIKLCLEVDRRVFKLQQLSSPLSMCYILKTLWDEELSCPPVRDRLSDVQYARIGSFPNPVYCDEQIPQSFIKRLVNHGRDFFSLETTWRALRGYEAKNMRRLGQVGGVEKESAWSRWHLLLACLEWLTKLSRSVRYYASGIPLRLLQHNSGLDMLYHIWYNMCMNDSLKILPARFFKTASGT